ncbi:MAG: hypothetical protein ABIK09_20815 [Pseudomonadota bacterium]
MLTARAKIVAWGSAVLVSFLSGLGTGRWIWRTAEDLPGSFAGAQADVQQVLTQGVQAAQVFTLGVAGSVALIVFLIAAIILLWIQSSRRGPKDG